MNRTSIPQISGLRTFAAVAVLLLTLSTGHAALLNWSTVTWSGPSQSYNADGVAGNDITVAYTTSVPGSGSPTAAISAVNGATDLEFSVDDSGMGATLTNNFTVTITFIGTYASGAKAVSFTLNDVDASLTSGGFQDRVSVTALNGATPVSITATNSGVGSVNSISPGSGTLSTNPIATGNSSTSTNPQGDVTISTGGATVTSITFVWSNPNSTYRSTQWIGLGNISFVPEVASSSAALVLCGVLLTFGRRRIRHAAA